MKIQDGKEKEMTTDEQLTCKNLRKHIVVEEDVPDTCDDFASMILNRKKQAPSTKYTNTRFILPTSNILERFSVALVLHRVISGNNWTRRILMNNYI